MKKAKHPKRTKFTVGQLRRRHAKIRASQRYGVDVNKHDYRKILQMIRQGKAEFLRRATNSKSIVKVEYQGKEMLAVYSRKHQEICTFLPRGAA